MKKHVVRHKIHQINVIFLGREDRTNLSLISKIKFFNKILLNERDRHFAIPVMGELKSQQNITEDEKINFKTISSFLIT